MSDHTAPQGTDEVDGGRHAAATGQENAAERALAAGDDARAEELLEAALRTDPDALATALAQDGPAFPADAGTASDEDVAAISRTIQPHGEAPSRAGITGSGSGADDM